MFIECHNNSNIFLLRMSLILMCPKKEIIVIDDGERAGKKVVVAV